MFEFAKGWLRICKRLIHARRRRETTIKHFQEVKIIERLKKLPICQGSGLAAVGTSRNLRKRTLIKDRKRQLCLVASCSASHVLCARREGEGETWGNLGLTASRYWINLVWCDVYCKTWFERCEMWNPEIPLFPSWLRNATEAVYYRT